LNPSTSVFKLLNLVLYILNNIELNFKFTVKVDICYNKICAALFVESAWVVNISVFLKLESIVLTIVPLVWFGPNP
jgi:hypothetical protein